MASTTFTVLNPALTGTEITAKGSVASSETLTISPSTADNSLRMDRLYVRVENQNSTASVTLSLGVGTEYSGLGIGAASISVGTAATVIVGGEDFDGNRFMTSGGTIVFTQTGTGPTQWEAYQFPMAIAHG